MKTSCETQIQFILSSNRGDCGHLQINELGQVGELVLVLKVEPVALKMTGEQKQRTNINQHSRNNCEQPQLIYHDLRPYHMIEMLSTHEAQPTHVSKQMTQIVHQMGRDTALDNTTDTPHIPPVNPHIPPVSSSIHPDTPPNGSRYLTRQP